ncbi:BaeS Signal transduction histidine kinase [Pyrenophora tritici-repentis]|nr:BaeS Signal transduction histidine kinase [Pyrenophora tritici-repentis]
MSFPIADPAACTPSSAAIDNHERVRAYEIAAYLSAASFPFDIEGGPPPNPVPSTDITLNALVQHGVHRLDCDRAFLSLIDNRNQYICAEMTKHQSLTSPDPTHPLLLGTSHIALEWGVCPYTMSIFHGRPVALPDSPYIVADKSYFCIKDFREVPMFAPRPFVAGYPHMVSYIEVPLCSISGHILGSYCVVDNKERDFLDPAALATLREVGDAISSYLNLKRVEAGKSRSERMMDSLRHLVGSGRLEVTPKSGIIEPKAVEQSPFHLDVFSSASQRDLGTRDSDTVASDQPSNSSPSCQPVNTKADAPHDSSTTSDLTENALPLALPAPAIQSSGDDPSPTPASRQDTYTGQMSSVLSTQIGNLFSIAADKIGHAMDLNGLDFFDVVATGTQHGSGQGRSLFADASSLRQEDTLATPLSYYRKDDVAAQHPEGRPSQSLIQRLTATYTRGHVFAVDEYGVFQHGGEDAQDSSKTSTSEDNNWSDFFKYIPKARYVMFIPLWHYQRESCYATCIAWVSDTGKTLDTGDLNSLVAFGNSLMAEIFRLEASANTQSKSDFVSSISHELRSPLHGILASIELIQENTHKDSELLPEITMIESCASTLLDTFDHLLEYSKVNSRAGAAQRGGMVSKHSATNARPSSVPVDLVSMVEEVLETVSLGHDYASRIVSGLEQERQRGLDPPSETVSLEPIVVTTHVEKGRDWVLPIEQGAWKRILLNVISNALKYTKKGYIDVRLAYLEAVDGGLPHISLIVTDTGVGMSEQFLKYHLFTPFTQEDVLSPGTGLGLSLVKSIVESLQGKILVESTLGKGTRITIEIPTSRRPLKNSRPGAENDSIPLDILRGKTVGLLSLSRHRSTNEGFSTRVVSPPEVLEHSIRNICEDRFGMKFTNSLADASSTDVLLIDAHTLGTLPTPDFETLLTGYTSKDAPQVVVVLDSFSKIVAHKVGFRKATHMTILVTGKSLRALLVSALDEANEKKPSLSSPSPAPLALENGTEKENTSPTAIPENNNNNTEAATPILKLQQETVLAIRTRPPQPTQSQHTSTIQTLRLPPSQPPPPNCRFHNLLLVDDNLINLKMLSAFAKRLNVRYSSATNGAEAVQLYQSAAGSRDAFDCVFMDISMPVMDGFQAVVNIRKVEDEVARRVGGVNGDENTNEGIDHGEERRRPFRAFVFALTGLGSDKARREASVCGFDEFLLKPVRFKDVMPLLGPLEDK